MIFSKRYYSDMKDYFHPNIHRFIEKYTFPEDNLYFLPPYHDCGKKNKHGQKQLIDYKNGKQCIDPTWRQIKIKSSKYQCGTSYTRYMPYNDEKIKTFLKSKGDYIYNYRTNQFDHLSVTLIGDSYHRFLNFKDLFKLLS